MLLWSGSPLARCLGHVTRSILVFVEFVISPFAVEDGAVSCHEDALAVAQRVPVLTNIVLSTGIQHPAESVRHLVTRLSFVYDVVWIDYPGYAIELVICAAELALNNLSILEHLLRVLILLFIEVYWYLAAFSNLLDG